jgi:hypothetical protein
VRVRRRRVRGEVEGQLLVELEGMRMLAMGIKKRKEKKRSVKRSAKQVKRA